MSERTRVDWIKLGRRLQEVQAQMTHHEDTNRCGDEFYAEALRRTLGAHEAPHTSYESVNTSTGLMTVAEADWTRDVHTVNDRLNRETAEKRVTELYEENKRVIRDAARILAKLIRGWTNDRTVPAKYRREGALIAADWIDPDSPASPHKYDIPAVTR